MLERPKVCRYCGSPVVFTSNAEIYGKEYGNGKQVIEISKKKLEGETINEF